MFTNDPGTDEFLILSTGIMRRDRASTDARQLRAFYSQLCADRGWCFITAYPTRGASDRGLFTVDCDLMTMNDPQLITLSDRARRELEDRMMVYSKPTKYDQRFYARWGIALWLTVGFYSHSSYIKEEHVYTLCCEIRDIVKSGIVPNETAKNVGAKP